MTINSWAARTAFILAAATTLAPAPSRAGSTDDLAIESILREGHVVSVRDLGIGVTKPKKLVVERDGETRKACFKTLDKAPRFRQRTQRRTPDHQLSDRYQYERAAYLLDRRLGLDMVPVAVLRVVEGTHGAAIDWISDAIDERQRRQENLHPSNAVEFSHQQSIMRVFDALILNSDRHPGNLLHTPDDGWRLHLIDHSRSFRLDRELPQAFVRRPITLPRWLFAELQSIDTSELTELLDGLVGRLRIEAMMARRDQIIAKVERDRGLYGDAVVFHRDVEHPTSVSRTAAISSSGTTPLVW